MMPTYPTSARGKEAFDPRRDHDGVPVEEEEYA